MNKDDYVDSMRSNIDDARVKMNLLTKELRQKSGETRIGIRRKYHRAKDQINEIDKKLDRVDEITDESWQDVKMDLDVMWQQVKEEVLEGKGN